MSEKLTKKLQGEIGKVLKANMPEYVCGVVRDRLELCDHYEKQVDDQADKIDHLLKELKELKALKLCADNFKQDTHNLHVAQAELTHQQLDFDRNKKVFELEQELKAQQAITDNTMEIMRKLTRNTEYRRQFFKNEDIVDEGGVDSNGYRTMASHTGCRKSTDETITETEE
jgi:hypothetical protein